MSNQENESHTNICKEVWKAYDTMQRVAKLINDLPKNDWIKEDHLQNIVDIRHSLLLFRRKLIFENKPYLKKDETDNPKN